MTPRGAPFPSRRTRARVRKGPRLLRLRSTHRIFSNQRSRFRKGRFLSRPISFRRTGVRDCSEQDSTDLLLQGRSKLRRKRTDHFRSETTWRKYAILRVSEEGDRY